jgi:SAM-dependent methyltransferase
VWSLLLPHCKELGFAWDAELIAVARARHVPVQEVPISWRHDPRSRVNLLRDGGAMVRAIPRILRSARQAAAEPDRSPSGGGVFDAENADLLMAADSTHWWFRSKAAFVATALRRTRTEAGDGWLVDVGAGAGGVTAMVGWDVGRTMVVEGNAAMAAQAGRRGLLAAQGEVAALPLGDGVAAVVSLLDVIEHLDDPLPCLREARRVLAHDGRLVVNVPAHQWLWSPADEALGHFRRYSRARLRRELAAAGFEPVFATHVFSWLVPPVWATRRLARGADAELGLDKTSPVIDRAAMVLTAAERSLVGRLGLPLGTSVLCVARPR